MPLDELVSFFILWFLMTIPLGPNALICIDTSLHYGWPRALLVPIGITFASLIYGLISLSVFALFVTAKPRLFSIMVFVGSLYLIFLGVKILLRPVSSKKIPISAVASARLLVIGMSTSFSNPKALLVYLAVLPGLATNSSLGDPTIITVVCLTVLAVYVAYSWFAKLLRKTVIGHTRRTKLLDSLAGLSFIAIALKNMKYSVSLCFSSECFFLFSST